MRFLISVRTKFSVFEFSSMNFPVQRRGRIFAYPNTDIDPSWPTIFEAELSDIEEIRILPIASE